MNIERILELADIIEKTPHCLDPLMEPKSDRRPTKFNMVVWCCNGVACIGGWAATLWAEDGAWLKWGRPTKRMRQANEEGAGRALGLGERQALELFYPHTSPTWNSSECSAITPKLVATVLRELAKTGKVDWGIAPPRRRKMDYSPAIDRMRREAMQNLHYARTLEDA